MNVLDVLPPCIKWLDFANVSVIDADTLLPVSFQNNSTFNKLDVVLDTLPIGGKRLIDFTAHYYCPDCFRSTNLATVTWTSLPHDSPPYAVSGTCPNGTGSCTPWPSASRTKPRNLPRCRPHG